MHFCRELLGGVPVARSDRGAADAESASAGASAAAHGPPTDAGFALAELLVAGTAVLLLSLPAYAMLRRTYDVADLLATRFAQNAQARQIAAVLADGNPNATVLGSQTLPVRGLHARKVSVATDLPQGSSLRSTSSSSSSPAYRFTLADGSAKVTGDAVAVRSVACLAQYAPMPDCAGTETKQVDGWLGNTPVVTTTGPGCAGATGCSVVSVSFPITSPFRAARAKAAASVVTEQYRMQFNMNLEQ